MSRSYREGHKQFQNMNNLFRNDIKGKLLGQKLVTFFAFWAKKLLEHFNFLSQKLNAVIGEWNYIQSPVLIFICFPPKYVMFCHSFCCKVS